MKTLKLTFILCLAGLALAACAGGTTFGMSAPQERSLTVVGQGEALGDPDQAQIQVGVDILGETVLAAAEQNQAAVQKIMAALDKLGVDPLDIQTSNFNVWVEQRYNESGMAEVGGYHVSNQVNVTVRQIDQVSEILGAVMESGANNIYGITFSVADQSALQEAARVKAMADARSRAEALAKLANLELDEVKVISEVFSQPGPIYGRVLVETAMAAGPSISPGQLSYQMQVQVTFAIK